VSSPAAEPQLPPGEARALADHPHPVATPRPAGRLGRLRRPAAGLDTLDAVDLPTRSGAILEVNDLSVEYLLDTGPVLAVDHVSFGLDPGEFVGVVGESGCGKSTMLFAVARLLSPPAEIISGNVIFKGRNMVRLTESALTAIRWKDLSVVMQSAMNALNPVKSIGAQFKDAMQAHGVTSNEAIAQRSAEVLRMVGIDPIHLKSYPHQLSGGMRQRSMIAMALLFTPELVIMDEPTSALDVVAQRSLMVQIKELQQQIGFAVIFVTHDMSLVSHFSDKLMVMYAGQVAEIGPTRHLFDSPSHPYTVGLMDAFPSIRGPKRSLSGIPGRPPDLARPQQGCWFSPRCPKVFDRCRTDPPPLYRVGGTDVRCFLFDDGAAAGSTS
jgi:peptide/nickel transport system ATP-binding protein